MFNFSVFHCYNDKKEQDLIANLFALTESELLDEIDLWCGHFVLFIKNKEIKIYNDACASFKVFYGEEDDKKVVDVPEMVPEPMDFPEMTFLENTSDSEQEELSDNPVVKY